MLGQNLQAGGAEMFQLQEWLRGRSTLVLFVRKQQVQALGLFHYCYCQDFHTPESSLETHFVVEMKWWTRGDLFQIIVSAELDSAAGCGKPLI